MVKNQQQLSFIAFALLKNELKLSENLLNVFQLMQ